MGNKAYLVLENGKVFCGESFGAAGEVTAEVVFTTGMTGYLETLTDKSYFGQIVVQTFPLIGNYGVIPSDFEGKIIGPCGYIVKEWCQSPSNFRSEGDLDTFFKERGVIGLCGIDTRALTKVIRESGVMNGMITTELTHVDMDKIHSYRVTNAVESTSVTEMTRRENPEKTCTVALMDYGYKKSIADCLIKRGCAVTVYPHDTSAEAVLAAGHDGVMLSNGPGDPAENICEIAQIRAMMGRIPIFGICLGHQMMALAQGAKTAKMKFGHRGANQPAKDLQTGRVYVTSQNHGYAVEAASLAATPGVLRFVNVNDGSVEGVDYPGLNAFSVQFHPEAHGGPRDSEGLFDRFIATIGGERDA